MRLMLLEVMRARVAAEGSLEAEEINCYVDNWGREGDFGVVAVHELAGPVGAAWIRMFDFENHGAGFVSPALPEVIGAVSPDHRGKKLGRLMLKEVIAMARQRQCAFISVAAVRDSSAHDMLLWEGFADAGLSGEEDPTVILLTCV